MKFDPYAFLADLSESTTPPRANPAIRAIPDRSTSTISTNSTPSAPRSGEMSEPVPRRADPKLAIRSRPEAEAFPYGHAVNGNPRTWMGRIVSLDDWRRLTEWERHGSTGKVWNGLLRQWE